MGRSLDRKIRGTRKPFMMNHGDIRGTLTIGKVADLLVLAGDPNKLTTDEIKDLKVSLTVLSEKVICDWTG
jgi:predicted amidohydrolase YtcJ